MNDSKPEKRKPNVVITETNLRVLELIATYYVVSRRMVQDVLFAHCKSPKAVVTRMKKLLVNGFIAKASMQIVPDGQNPVPVYHLTKKGAKALAAGRNDPEWLTANTRPPSNFLLYHWLGIVKMHMLINAAVALDEMLMMNQFHQEWAVINKDEPNPKLQFTLQTRLRHDPPLSVAPDFGFMLTSKGHRKVMYGEYDRNTDSIRRVTRKKPPGYAFMANHRRQKKHFPTCSELEINILLITQTEYRRDELATRIADRERPDLWRFAIESDLSPESFFRMPIWKKCSGEFCSLFDPKRTG
jgi:ribosomal protein L34E